MLSGLYQRWTQPLLLRPDRSLWPVGGDHCAAGAPVADGGRRALRASQEDLPAAHGGPSHVRDALRDTRGAPGRPPQAWTTWSVEHGVCGTGEPDDAPGDRTVSATDVGDSPGSTLTRRSSRMVAWLVPRCATAWRRTRATRPAYRTWWAAVTTSVSTADAGHGGRTNQSTLDSTRPVPLPAAINPSWCWLTRAGRSPRSTSGRTVGCVAHKVPL